MPELRPFPVELWQAAGEGRRVGDVAGALGVANQPESAGMPDDSLPVHGRVFPREHEFSRWGLPT